MNSKLFKLVENAANKIKQLPRKSIVRIISHHDADGISSAAIICTALYREGYRFHTTLMKNPFKKGLKRLQNEKGELAIFCDMGSGQIDRLEKLQYNNIIICDHHQPIQDRDKNEKILEINAHLCDIDGSCEGCGSTITFALAKTLNEKNIDLLPLALTGAVGDKQHLNGFKGYNKEIFDEGVKNNLIEKTNEWIDSKNKISDELYYSIEPYYKGLSGRKEEIDLFLKNLGIEEETLEDLSSDKREVLRSFLILKLLKNGCDAETIEFCTSPKYWSQYLESNLDRFAEILDACGKSGEKSLGLLIALNNKKLMDKAEEIRRRFKQKIIDGLIRLEDDKNVKQLEAIQYFYADDPSLGGVIGGIAINYFLRGDKPILSLSEMDDELHVSARGNHMLLKKGLDLGIAMREGAKSLGGIGGGHNIAAGATIKKVDKEKFLEIVDKIIKGQIS
jgi:RecJ-like exonuclease